MPFNYKPQQKLALEYPGNVVVSAGAGSGKTRVLVEKYFRLLVDEHPTWPVESVVAITFTTKAAGEIRNRIVKRIREELQEPGLSDARKQRLWTVRRELVSAPIGTIHNFCSRILREFAFEAGLTPDFAILEGAQESSVRREAVRSAVSEIVSAEVHPLQEDLLELLTVYSQRRLLGLLELMIRRRSEFSAVTSRYVKTGAEQLFLELKQFHDALAEQCRQQVRDALRDAVEELIKIPGGTELLQLNVGRWEIIQDSAVDWCAVTELLEAIRSSFFTKEGTLRKKIEKQTVFRDTDAAIRRLRIACSESGSAMRAIGTVDRINLHLAIHLSRIHLFVQEKYLDARSARHSQNTADQVDFTDLELLAEQLVSTNADVRRRLRDRFRYVIIDEFQDTSELQWQILQPILCDASGTLRRSVFFGVGDPKQGVYGFRQASTTLFQRVRDQVQASNVHVVEPDGGNGGVVSIAYNFRTLERPLSAINALFEKLMHRLHSAEQVEFEPLVLQRQSEPGTAEMIICTPAATDVEADSAVGVPVEVEANVVAELVQQLITTGRNGRAYEPGEIAILFRKRKHFTACEAALRLLNIPFLTHQGQGLFEQPEVTDLLAFLRLLINPGSSINAAHVARSSYVNFTDDLLLKVSMLPERSFWAKCQLAARSNQFMAEGATVVISAEEKDRLKFLNALWTSMMQMLGRVEVGDLLDYLIDTTGARLIAEAGPRGRQASLNIDKLLNFAQKTRTTDLDEFLAYIEGENAGGRGEGEAVPDTDDMGAVRIMTIHAAKGLEFPVIILPELNDPVSLRPEQISSDGTTWLALAGTGGPGAETPFLHSYIEEARLKRAIAEEQRVLYVAMTRCRDQLFLTATVQPGSKPKQSFYSWISDHINEPSTDAPGEEAILQALTITHWNLPIMKQEDKSPPPAVTVHHPRFEQNVPRVYAQIAARVREFGTLHDNAGTKLSQLLVAPITAASPDLINLDVHPWTVLQASDHKDQEQWVLFRLEFLQGLRTLRVSGKVAGFQTQNRFGRALPEPKQWAAEAVTALTSHNELYSHFTAHNNNSPLTRLFRLEDQAYQITIDLQVGSVACFFYWIEDHRDLTLALACFYARLLTPHHNDEPRCLVIDLQKLESTLVSATGEEYRLARLFPPPATSRVEN